MAADPFLAEITLFAGNFAPRGWAFCDGQLLSISSNSALFSLVGTIYGGDGRTTFGLPDLRGRAVIGPRHGPGLSSYREGQKGGVEYVILNSTQIPSHSHSAAGTVQASFVPPSFANSNQPAGRNFGAPGAGTNVYTNNANTTTMAANNVSVAVGNTGGNGDHENRQPFQAINYIIALFGIYPSRN